MGAVTWWDQFRFYPFLCFRMVLDAYGMDEIFRVGWECDVEYFFEKRKKDISKVQV